MVVRRWPIHMHLLLCRTYRLRLFLVGNCTIDVDCCFGRVFIGGLIWFGHCWLVTQASNVSHYCVGSIGSGSRFVFWLLCLFVVARELVGSRLLVMFCLEFPSVGLLKLFLQPLKNLVVISLFVCSSVTLVACCSSVGLCFFAFCYVVAFEIGCG